MSPDSVYAQVEKIVGSEGFIRSERLIRFLRFVVERRLKSQEDTLKEYVIGVEVFDKPETFDPRIDPIVRVEAGRLRSKLREYYGTVGRNDPIVISFLKRSYVPFFELRQDTPAPATETEAATAQAALESAPAPAQTPERQERVDTTPSIVVLPFADMSPEKDQEHFCDGITEEIIMALGSVDGLRVVARTSAFQFKGKAVDIRQIGEELKVSAVLEGSVRKSNDRVRITTQLCSSEDGYHLWSGSYNHELEDVFEIHQGVAEAIARALRVKLLGDKGPRKPATESSAAQRSYLKGRGLHLGRRTEEALVSAVSSFENAISEDPNYAPPYAGMAETYVELAISSARPAWEVMPRAKLAARRAVELDPNLGEAHAALGLVNALYDWDWPGSAKEFELALRLSPRNPTVHYWFAMSFLLPQGRLEEAEQAMNRSIELDPVFAIGHAGLGHVLFMKGSCEKAIEQYEKAIRLDPDFYRAHWGMARAFTQMRRFPEALTSFERVRRICGQHTFRLGGLGYAQAEAGNLEEAEQTAALLRGEGIGYAAPLDLAEVYIGLKQPDLAMQWLERAYEERATWLTWLRIDPIYRPLHGTAEFRNLLKRIGLGTDEVAAAGRTSTR